MIIRKHGYALDVDVEDTLKYSKEHVLCDCDEDRNLYAQIAEKFPKLKEFLAELGLLIERPDEISSYAVEDYIDYHFVSYTVIGKILESDKCEIDLFDGGLFLNIVIDNLQQKIPRKIGGFNFCGIKKEEFLTKRRLRGMHKHCRNLQSR